MTPGVSVGTCKTCALPLVWSDDQRRTWCCVWGDHLPVVAAPEVKPKLADAASVVRPRRRLRVVS
jgi:hypothetical protein